MISVMNPAMLLLLTPLHAATPASPLADRGQALLPDALSAGEYYGWSIAGGGDVDGDGYADVLIGAPSDDILESGLGVAYLWYGSSQGLQTSRVTLLDPTDGLPGAAFGWSLDNDCDVNGDGYDDVIVSAPDWYYPDEATGTVAFFLGSPTGLDLSTETHVRPVDSTFGDYFAGLLSCAGDVDRDGYDDVVVGRGRGGVAPWLLRGGSDGLSDARVVELLLPGGGDYGVYVAGVGDLDADGYADVAVSEGYDGVHVLLGGPAGLDLERRLWIGRPHPDAALFGLPAGGGDIDGDGFDDLVIGDISDDTVASNAGALYVYYGHVDGLDPDRVDKVVAAGSKAGDGVGHPIDFAGDIDGDGYDDLVCGVDQADGEGGAHASGKVVLFFGGPDGIDSSREEWLQAPVKAGADLYGAAVAGAGDTDGNGAPDVVVGGYGFDWAGAQSGGAYVYYGDCRTGAVSYRDLDGDRFGDPDAATTQCDVHQGWTEDSSDCDDSDGSVYPGAPELVGDGIDQDCDGTDPCYADEDGDGFRTDDVVASDDADCDDPGEASADMPAGDCDDSDAAASPGGVEVVADGIDGDCDGDELCWVDDDGDGYLLDGATVQSADLDCDDWSEADDSALAGDCDDDDPTVYPGSGPECDGPEGPPGATAPAPAGCSALPLVIGPWGLLLALVLPLGRRRC